METPEERDISNPEEERFIPDVCLNSEPTQLACMTFGPWNYLPKNPMCLRSGDDNATRTLTSNHKVIGQEIASTSHIEKTMETQEERDTSKPEEEGFIPDVSLNNFLKYGGIINMRRMTHRIVRQFLLSY
ncbi:hypothetical protein TKK_0012611 [Trichogramma kaykai]